MIPFCPPKAVLWITHLLDITNFFTKAEGTAQKKAGRPPSNQNRTGVLLSEGKEESGCIGKL
jgi:hypothetical protein